MIPEIPVFEDCKSYVEKTENVNQLGKSICFIYPKGLDLSCYAALQAICSLSGLRFGDFVLPPATRALLVDGYTLTGEVVANVTTYSGEKDLSKISVLSLRSYNEKLKKQNPCNDIVIVDEKMVDNIVGFAESEERPCVIFNDLHSLTGGGALCKPREFKELHDRLKSKGATQLYFLNTINEAFQIASAHDLIFTIAKNPDAIYPTIRVVLHSAAAHLQDTILPMEIELHRDQTGDWRVETSITITDQDAAIKALAKMGRTRAEIAAAIGSMSPSTVGRRLYAMQERGEIKIIKHRVYEA